jgi:cytochrome c-type biogenesis protein CcmH/NrfF
MRKVAEMVSNGMNEHEIREHYEALYGERILIVSDGRTGQVPFALPVVAFVVCLGALLLFLRRTLKGKTDSCPDPAVSEHGPTSDAIRAEIERETGEGF